MSDIVAASPTIYGVYVTLYYVSGWAGQSEPTILVYDGAKYTPTAKNDGASGLYAFMTAPPSGGSWTKTKVDGLEIGARAPLDANSYHMTQVYGGVLGKSLDRMALLPFVGGGWNFEPLRLRPTGRAINPAVHL